MGKKPALPRKAGKGGKARKGSPRPGKSSAPDNYSLLNSPHVVPTKECPVCGSRNVHYNKERAELVCRECGEIHAQIV